MDFRIDCSCGHFQMVRESAAGSTLGCPCGKELQVPKLSQLRKLAGRASHDLSPEVILEHMLLANQLPVGNHCAYCGAETASAVIVQTDCSGNPPVNGIRETMKLIWGMAVLAMWFIVGGMLAVLTRVIIISSDTSRNEPTARLLIYPLPILVCPACQPALIDPAIIKRCLSKDPDYRRLLEKYPNAIVAVKL